MFPHKSYFSKGILLGLVLAVFVEVALIAIATVSCRNVSRNHKEAYFAFKIDAISGSYCQVIVSDSQKEFADSQVSFFNSGRNINNSSISLDTFLLMRFLHLVSLGLVLMIVFGMAGFFIEKE